MFEKLAARGARRVERDGENGVDYCDG